MTEYVPLQKIIFEAGKAARQIQAASQRSPDDVIAEVAGALERENPGMDHWGFVAGIAYEWAGCGFPRVEPSHRLAASLMATSAPPTALANTLKMPWRTFMISLPSGLFPVPNCFAIASHSGTDGETVLVTVGSSIHFGVEPSLASWNRLEWDPVSQHERGAFHNALGDERETEMFGRLLVGVCMEMSEYRPASESQRTGSVASRKTKERDRPHTFKLTRDVKVDVRTAISDYVAGRSSKSPTVQTLVRGHWKMQPHGSGRLERKAIHIEPYWRGPEDSPAAVRAHVLD